jgi:hypothetical protein
VKRRAAAWCFLLATVAFAGACTSGRKPDPRDADERAGAAKPALPDPGALVRVAQQRGVAKCLPRIEELASPLLKGANYRADIVAEPVRPDTRLFAAMISRQGPQGVHQFASLAVAPDAACSSTVGITTAWAIPCEQVAGRAFARFRPTARLSGNVAVLQLDSGPQVFLMPAPGGCLSLEQTMLY